MHKTIIKFMLFIIIFSGSNFLSCKSFFAPDMSKCENVARRVIEIVWTGAIKESRNKYYLIEGNRIF